MKNDNEYIWRSMTLQDIPLVCATFRTGNPEVNEVSLERLSQFPPKRLEADTLLVSTAEGGIAAAGIVAVFPSDENSLIGWLEGVVQLCGSTTPLKW